jgi:hypothetical protein
VLCHAEQRERERARARTRGRERCRSAKSSGRGSSRAEGADKRSRFLNSKRSRCLRPRHPSDSMHEQIARNVARSRGSAKQKQLFALIGLEEEAPFARGGSTPGDTTGCGRLLQKKTDLHSKGR